VSHEAQSKLSKLSSYGAAIRPKVTTLDGESHLTKSDKVRIQDIIRECRSRFGKGGQFLFGRFSIPDAMLAPVILFLETNAIEVDAETRAYMSAILATEAMTSWREAFCARPSVAVTPRQAQSYIN
jgi:glutathione S-transferase